MNKPAILLAKSLTSDPVVDIHDPRALVGHHECVVTSAVAILESIRESSFISSLKWPWEDFKLLVLLSLCMHDLGKATNLFQGMLAYIPEFVKKAHPVRHEVLTALLITVLDTPLKNWFSKVCKEHRLVTPWTVSWVAGGHHLKLNNDVPKKETDRLVRTENLPNEFIFWGSHPDIHTILSNISDYATSLSDVPILQDVAIPIAPSDDLFAVNLQSIVDDYVLEATELSDRFTGLSDEFAIACAKSIATSADVAGSAIWKARSIGDSGDWIRDSLRNSYQPEDMDKIILSRLGSLELRPFQKKIASSKHQVTLAIAGCGNGKTIGAEAWFGAQGAGRKAILSYPTTGTASAGFEDYVLHQSDLDRTLVHNRSNVDLEKMLLLENAESGIKDRIINDETCLSSLNMWTKQIVVCTVDTVLGLIQNQRRGLFSFPAFANAAFVFDELHSYDPFLFGAFLVFLKVFTHAPILLMSASIPKNRLEKLYQVAGSRMGDPIRGDVEMESLLRYFLEWRSAPIECWDEVIAALNRGCPFKLRTCLLFITIGLICKYCIHQV